MQGARMALPLRHLKFKAENGPEVQEDVIKQKMFVPANPSRYLELTDIKNNSTHEQIPHVRES